MKLPDFLRTPLAATACVIMGMGALAIPLQRLTSASSAPKDTVVEPQQNASTPCWLTLKLLAPAKSITLRQMDGTVAWSATNLPAGETETRQAMPISQSRIHLILEIEFSNPTQETAAFLSIAPDGMKEAARYAIGTGMVRELLEFTWSEH